MDIDDIISLQEFTLSNNYFAFSDRINKQVHGCAMGGPVRSVVANLCMKQIKESAISDSSILSKNWRRYFEDSLCIIRKDGVSAFHDTFKSIDRNILFQIELEYDGRFHFLDNLVSRRNGAIAIVYIYR